MHLDHSLLHPELSANLVSFARLLRAQGVAVGPNEQSDALRALQVIDPADYDAFRTALRLSLTKSRQDQEVFDKLFDDFWVALMMQPRRTPDATVAVPEAGGAGSDTPAGPLSIKDWLPGRSAAGEDAAAIRYSPYEVLARKDFRHLRPDELRDISHLIRQLVRPLAVQHSRRHQRSRRPDRIDLRRAIRLSLRRGGEVVDLAYRRRRRERLKLVMLCDVSQSMALYTLFLIQFIYAFQHVFRQVETFVFSTALYRITSVLRAGHLGAVLEALPDEVPGWGGGTRIGAALDAFSTDHRRLLTAKTIVVILSDGWDTGDLGVLEAAMRTIHRKAYRVIWLNPLMGYGGFTPSAGGLRVAQPYIDTMAPAHNVESLRQTIRLLVKP